MSSAPNYSPGVMKYVEAAQKLLAERDAALARMKTMRFDTIAVHGLYTVEEALNRNQGAVIEPLYLSTSQAYADSDELEAALAYLVPTWCYTRIANPTTYYLEWVLALLEGYRAGCDTSCCVTASGMGAIMSAIDPLLVKQKDGPERINFVSCIQVYGGTFQQFSLRKMKERGIECRWVRHPWDIEDWKSHIDEDTRFLYMEMPSNPAAVVHGRQGPGRPGPLLGHPAHHRRHLRDAGPDAAHRPRGRHRRPFADQVDHLGRLRHRRGAHQPQAHHDQGRERPSPVQGELRRIRQVPALPRQRAGLRPGQRHLRPERPADPALQDGRRQRRTARRWPSGCRSTRRSTRSTTSACRATTSTRSPRST
ncbi:MAG: PLP-dependent transferase [Marinilabiliales bacterium]|nr:PLP-dependent transferase [Marinilabiliales bacterium]